MQALYNFSLIEMEILDFQSRLSRFRIATQVMTLQCEISLRLTFYTPANYKVGHRQQLSVSLVDFSEIRYFIVLPLCLYIRPYNIGTFYRQFVRIIIGWPLLYNSTVLLRVDKKHKCGMWECKRQWVNSGK